MPGATAVMDSQAFSVMLCRRPYVVGANAPGRSPPSEPMGGDLIRHRLDISGGSIQDVAQALADTGRRE